MTKQLFGWTNPQTPPVGNVGYAQAHLNDDGSLQLVVRQHRGGVGGEAIDIPREEAVALAESILDAYDGAKAEERPAKAPEPPKDQKPAEPAKAPDGGAPPATPDALKQ